jgi:Peptidase C65 Otubain
LPVSENSSFDKKAIQQLQLRTPEELLQHTRGVVEHSRMSEAAAQAAPDVPAKAESDHASLDVQPAQSNQGQVAADGTAAADASAEVTSTAVDPDRPTDEQILSYENKIREEQRERPLLGEKESLEVLKSEYQSSGTVFLPKINFLTNQYRHFRRTRQGTHSSWSLLWPFRLRCTSCAVAFLCTLD